MSEPIIFMHIAWAKYYEGMDDDAPIGAHRYLKNGEGHERQNFKPTKGRYVGYAPVMSKSVRIEKLGAEVSDETVNGVTVVWTATAPNNRGRVIVGWYKNATVFRHARRDKKTKFLIHAWTDRINGYLVPDEERMFNVPNARQKTGYPGMAAIWYPELSNADDIHEFLARLRAYLRNPDATRRRQASRQNDIEKRQAVERIAMETVEAYYVSEGYAVDDVCMQKKGWDQTATKGRETLLIETKGLSGSDVSFELTPNEYVNARGGGRSDFRICVVTNALSVPKLHIFRPEGGRWTFEGDELVFEERVAARCNLV